MQKFIFLLGLLIPVMAYADYPSARPNQNVCAEIEDQPDRLIPKSDWICAAVDGQGYARSLGSKDFYHGVGHWTQLRTEISWDESVALNFRSIFYNGSSSEGYAHPTENYHLASFRFIYPGKVLGGTVSLRSMDLDRQTIGAGLFVEQRESNGGLVVWDFEKFQFKFLQESTGFLMAGDDVSNPEISFYGRRLGLGSAFFYKQDTLGDRRDPYFYLYSILPADQWEIHSEAGMRNNQLALLAKVANESFFGNLSVQSVLQSRYYANGFAAQIERQTELQYVSYDQYNKVFTDSMNIFAKDDNVIVYSSILNFGYEFSHTHRWAWLNELAQFAYRDVDTENYYFTRLEYDLFPYPLREDHFALFVSNKVLNDSYYRPPWDRSPNSKQLFWSPCWHVGVEGKFRF